MSDAIIRENRAYWTKRAYSYSQVNQEELSTDQRKKWKDMLVERIQKHFPNRAPDEIHILEAGTGPGFFAILLCEAGYRVTAIDLTPSMLEEARKNAGVLADHINFIEMNAQALDFDDQQFDVVISRNLTWNLPEPEDAYAEWARVLKPGGLILNFDANWYRYLYDDEALTAYRADRQNSAESGVSDLNVGENFDKMEAIALKIPLSRVDRPAWDLNILKRLGLGVQADFQIWKRVWSQQEKLNFASTPLFMVCAEK